MLQDKLVNLTVKNFRSLANVSINTENLTVLFGPNGAGKSAFFRGTVVCARLWHSGSRYCFF